MKKNVYSFLLMFVCIFIVSNIVAQTASSWNEVIEKEEGDVVVVKGYLGTGYYNTLLTAVKGDTTATGERRNLNRIYETIPGEMYISDVTLELDVSVPELRLYAPKAPEGVNPPLHIRAKKVDNTFDKTFFQTYGNFTMKNQYFVFCTVNDTWEEREFCRCMTPNSRFSYEGCIFELTAWTQQLPQASYISYYFKDCKFLNVGHEATLEKGCMIETRSTPPDTIWMENCTFLNGGSNIISLDNTAPNYLYFNHNTIVNCAQPPLCFSTAAEMIVENNIFVNTGFVPDYPGFYTMFDDEDQLAKGIVNSDTIKDFFIYSWWDSIYPLAEADRKILFDRNAAWWDSRLTDMFNSELTPIPAELGYEWLNQMILMNDRTKAMFDDDAAYPYFTLGNNIEGVEPDFANYADLIPEWIEWTITNCTPGAPNGGTLMPLWRTNQEVEMYVIDWPPLANLSYTDATLKSAGMGGFPLGDLNWFPAEKEQWEKTNESAILWDLLKTGKLPSSSKEIKGVNSNIVVYPNPFSSSATVKFNISKSAYLELSVYNVQGKKVRMLNLGQYAAGVHEVSLSKGDLTPGMYFIQLNNRSNQSVMSSKITIK